MRIAIVVLAALWTAGCAPKRVASTLTADAIAARTGKPVSPRAPGPGGAPPAGISLDRPLTADDAVAVAVWNNAQLRADLAGIGLAEADLQDAQLFLRNPRLEMLVPIGAKPFEMVFNFPVEVFFQRPRRIEVSQKALDQLAQSLIQNGVNTARDARLAHADLVQAQERLALARESAALRDRIATITAARLRAGDIGEMEVIAAAADSGAAAEQVARLQHDVELARQRLCLVLGLPPSQALRAASSPLSQEEPAAMESLVERAMSSRADLRAAELAVSTATSRAKWERSRFLFLTGQLSSKGVGNNGILSGPGLLVDLPVFNRNQGLIARAEAEVEMAARQYLALKQRVALEVADARQQILQARDVLWRIRNGVLGPLERGAAVAEDQYKKGDVAYLFVLEQNRALIDARQRVIDSEAAIRRAEAQLERSVGSR